MQIKFTNAARKDLEGIFAYSKKMWGDHQARIYSHTLKDHVYGLAEDRGHSKPVAFPTSKDLHQTSCGKHIILFEKKAECILVVRILHQVMDIPNQMSSFS